jgi:ABC-type nitrate/sulfonate/bicarbonate transport system substrate-binding protein
MTIRHAIIRRAFGMSALACLVCGAGIRAEAADIVRVGVGAVYPTYAVFTAGNSLGIYQKQNLDMQITTFRGGPATQEALAAGAIDISAIAPGAVSLAIKKGVGEKIVALFTPPVPKGWYIMVPKDSPIKTIADLNGKNVGVTQKGSLTDFWTQRVATIAGITVNTVPLGGGVVPGVKAKQVDAAIVWPIFSYKSISDNSLRPIFSLGDKLPPSISEGVAVSNDLIDKHADVLKRWLTATSMTITYMQTHEDWSETFLKDYFKENSDEVVTAVYKDFIMDIRADGLMKKEWMDDSLLAAHFLGDEQPLTPDKIFDTAFTPIAVQ